MPVPLSFLAQHAYHALDFRIAIYFQNSIAAGLVDSLAKYLDEDGMSLQRRRLLKILSGAVGAGFLLHRNASAITESPSQSATAAPSADAVAKPESKGTEMEKVAGIGGLFFRAHDPKALGNWYQQHLGISLTPTAEGGTVWQQEAGPTAFTPFPETTKYFGNPQKAWMINFRVHDINKMVAQLRAAGIEVKDPESYPKIGSFARLHDPEGNPIELWQPA